MQKWNCSDPDTSQYYMKKDDYWFYFVEVREVMGEYNVCVGNVDLRDYSVLELSSQCAAFYPSLENIVKDYGFGEGLHIMAECIFEQMTGSELDLVIGYKTRREAIRYVHKYMNTFR